MQEEALQNGEVFFLDLSLRLKAEGIKHLPEDGGRLPVCHGGSEIGAVLPNGGLTIKKGAAENAAAGAQLRRVGDIFAFFRARGKSLTFAAKRREQRSDTQFSGAPAGTARERSERSLLRRGDGLLFGRYFDNDYSAAKQDFVIRAGLVAKGHVFSDDQLETVHYCPKETLERGNRGFEDENEIEALCNKIAQVLPEPAVKSKEWCLTSMNQTM